MYLLAQNVPFPTKPGEQTQENEPTVLIQIAFSLQLCGSTDDEHSSKSKKMNESGVLCNFQESLAFLTGYITFHNKLGGLVCCCDQYYSFLLFIISLVMYKKQSLNSFFMICRIIKASITNSLAFWLPSLRDW